jgi:hypothetical protein
MISMSLEHRDVGYRDNLFEFMILLGREEDRDGAKERTDQKTAGRVQC